MSCSGINSERLLCRNEQLEGQDMTFHLTAESTMIEVVMGAFDQLGGRANLENVYPVVDRLFRELGRDVPPRLDEQVHQIVDLHCSTNRALFEKTGHDEYRLHRPTLDKLA
jgi:hypothetical protein